MSQNYTIQDVKDVSLAGISASLSFTSSSKTSVGSSANIGYVGFRQVSYDPAGRELKVTIQDVKDVSLAGISVSLTFTSSSKTTVGSSANIGYVGFKETTSQSIFVIGTRVTQATLEVLSLGSPNIRLTMATIEVLALVSVPQEVQPNSVVASSSIGEPDILGVVYPSSLLGSASVGSPVVAGPVKGIVGFDLIVFGAGGIVSVDPNPTFVRDTQNAFELVIQGRAGSRVAQLAMEVLTKHAIFGVRTSQNPTELVVKGEGRARLAQLVTELVVNGVGRARISQITTEVLAYNDTSNLGSRISQQTLECLEKIEAAILPTTTTTSTTSTSSTTTQTSSTTTHSTTATVTFTFTIPDPRPIGSDRYPFVLPIPIEVRNAITIQNTEALPQMDFVDGSPVSAIGYGFFLGAFHPFDETSRALLGIYVPPEHGVGGP